MVKQLFILVWQNIHLEKRVMFALFWKKQFGIKKNKKFWKKKSKIMKKMGTKKREKWILFCGPCALCFLPCLYYASCCVNKNFQNFVLMNEWKWIFIGFLFIKKTIMRFKILNNEKERITKKGRIIITMNLFRNFLFISVFIHKKEN